MTDMYYDTELYELGWGFHFHKIFKRIKHAFKRVGKTVKKVAKQAVHVASGVVGGALGAAVYAADSYVSQYQQSPSPSSPAPRRPVYRPRPGSSYAAAYRTRTTSAQQGSSQQWEKYLPWIAGAGLLLMLRGK